MKYTDKLFSLRNRGFIVKFSSINVLQILRENITKSYSSKISWGLKEADNSSNKPEKEVFLRNRAEKKNEEKKVKILKEKRLQQRACLLLEKLISKSWLERCFTV